jgi:putative endonuclease
MSSHNKSGKLGEIYAAKYLSQNGYTILSTDHKTSFSEIDIIAMDNSCNTLCFIEVKTRKEGGMFDPAEAVDFNKQNNLKSAASAYISRYKIKNETRFDIIEVFLSAENPYNVIKINHIPNAF